MGIGKLIEPNQLDPGFGVMERPQASFGEVFSSGLKGLQSEVVTNSQFQRLKDARFDRARKFKEISGEDLSYKLTGEVIDLQEANKIAVSTPSGAALAQKQTKKIIDRFKTKFPQTLDGVKNISELKESLVDQHIVSLRTQDPEKYKDMKTTKEMQQIIAKQQIIDREKFEKVARNASGFNRVAGSLSAGLVLTTQDPVNYLALLVPGSQTRSIARAMLFEAGINAGVETLSQFEIAKVQAELGIEYGFTESATNVGFAALFGGGIGGLGKALENRTFSTMWGKIAENPRLKEFGQQAARHMERLSHVMENNPFRRNPELNRGRHVKSLEIASEKLGRNEPINASDLPISQQEFDSLRANITPDMNQFERHLAQQLKKFQTEEVRPSLVDQPYSVNTLPEQLLRKFDETPGKRVKADNLMPEEIQMLKEAGIVASKNNTFAKARVLKELQRRTKDGSLANVASDDISHLDQFRDSRIPRPSDNPLPTDARVDELNKLDEILLREEPTSVDVQKQILKQQESPDAINAELANFQRLADENPNLRVFFEDKEVSIKELLEEFEGDENFIKEISTCATGGRR